MSWNIQSDTIFVNTEDPEYYAELLSKIRRVANRRIESSCPGVFPGIQGFDGPLGRRLQIFLDAVADISLCQRGNVSATMASIMDHHNKSKIQLYIVFNHENDEAAGRCSEHLQAVFDMLRQVPCKESSTSESSKIISNDLENYLLGICRVIHNHSFDIFVHRVLKRSSKVSEIRQHIEQDQTQFTTEQRRTLLQFLKHVDSIIRIVKTASEQSTELPIAFMKKLLRVYSYWTEHNLIPDDSLPDNKLTLLDAVDTWLASKQVIGFQLRRWALKIMSFFISSDRLFSLTQSIRLRKFIDGKFSVQVLPSPTTTPYECYLTPDTVQETLDNALANTRHLFADQDEGSDREEERKLFIGSVAKNLDVSDVVHRQKPTVHAELAMTMAMARGEIKEVYSYIGVSKLSCIMCSQYIRAFNEVTQQKIATKGSNGKAYPGWFWPSHPDCDKELRQAFLKRNRQQLVEDFRVHVKTRQLSDCTVGSSRGRWKIGDEDEIDELDDEVFEEMFPGN